MINLIQGDCLEKMKDIPDKSIDMILTDTPYGITQCKWDSIIPLDLMWIQLKRIIKDNRVVVLFGSQPFTTKLISSNYDMFKYCWVWEKTRHSGHIHAKNKPMKIHEDICVFSNGVTLHEGQSLKRMLYKPQNLKSCNILHKTSTPSNVVMADRKNRKSYHIQKKTGYPVSVLKFNSLSGNVHPTQKPVDLMEYLIKTYSNENEAVLDFTMGSGTTGVACINLNRKFIGIELDEKYFNIAKERIENA